MSEAEWLTVAAALGQAFYYPVMVWVAMFITASITAMVIVILAFVVRRKGVTYY